MYKAHVRSNLDYCDIIYLSKQDQFGRIKNPWRKKKLRSQKFNDDRVRGMITTEMEEKATQRR